MIKQQIQKNQISAIKSHNSEELQVIRYILAQIKNSEIEKRTDLTDEEIVTLLRKEAKKLQDSIDAFSQAGRDDLVKEHKQQLAIVSHYLPQEMSDEELEQEIQAVIDRNSDLFAKNPRAVIGICVKELQSKADSSRIASTINRLIG